MVILELFSWWYSQGWADVARRMARRLSATARMFSVVILLQTLFAPWRRIITYPGASMQAHMRAFVDNLVSRCVGFVVRCLVLVAAVMLLLLVMILSLLELLIWPFIPLAPIILMVKGFTV